MSFSEIIATQNPWWSDPAARPTAPAHSRKPFRELQRVLSEADLQRAQVLLGPRQVGKTRLLWQVARHFLDDGWPPANVTYFDFSDDRFGRDRGLRDVFEAKPTGFRDATPRLLLLDEVTRAPRWDLALKQLVDRARSMPPGSRDRVLVTDSAAALVRGSARESLQGRIDEIRIHGLTFGEALHLQRQRDDESERDVYMRSPGALERYLETGGFPEHVTHDESRERVWERMRADVADRAIARDLSRERVDIERVTALFGALVQDSGGLFEAGNRAEDLPEEDGRGTDARTVRRWVSLLEQASLIDRLPPWHPGIRKGLVKSSRALKLRSKLYAEDHGFIPAFSPLANPVQRVKGKVYETAVFTHLRDLREQSRDFELYFFREGKGEDKKIDFVLAFEDAVLGLEVTSSKSPKKKRTDGARLADRAGLDRLIVVHGGPLEPREAAVAAEWPIGAFLLDPRACIERSLEWVRTSP